LQPLELKRGLYLAPEFKNFEADGILAATTSYKHPIKTGSWHYHENAMVCFVLKGGNVEKRIGLEFERLPGRVTFYHAGELHQNIYKLFPAKGFNLEIEPHFLQQYQVSETDINASLKTNPKAQFSMYRIYKELAVNDKSSVSSAHILLLDIIASGKGIHQRKAPPWIASIIEVLNDRWNENVTLNDLSRICNVHPITISKYFSLYFQCTLGDYQRKLKVAKAIMLIQSLNTSLTDIAHHCGFSDQSHFVRIFKRQTGFLPKEFQKL
jgi:AraC family transcriptional regulator